MHTAILALVFLWSSALGQQQVYRPRTPEELFTALRNAALAGQFPSDTQLLDLGFRGSVEEPGVEINAESGRLYVLVAGNNRNSFTMTWSPKQSSPVHEPLLSSLIAKTSHIELAGRERMKIVLNESNDGRAIFSEGFIVDLIDGKLHATIVEAFLR